MAKYTAHQQSKLKRVFGEFKAGTLRSSSGEKVTDHAQAVAIAMSEAGIAKRTKRAHKTQMSA